MDEDTRVLPIRAISSNLSERIFKSPCDCEGSELKLYDDVTFDLAKVYTLSVAVTTCGRRGTRMTLVLLTYACGRLVFGKSLSTFCSNTVQPQSTVSSPGFEVVIP